MLTLRPDISVRVVEDHQGVDQAAVDEVGAAVEVVRDRGTDFARRLTTPATLSTVIREVSTPLRFSLVLSEEKSRPSESRVFVCVCSSAIVALSGDTNRFTTSAWQRCCAACSADGESPDLPSRSTPVPT